MIRVVLADANILFSRVLRDYIVYSTAEGLIDLHWSEQILDELDRNLVEQRGFTHEQTTRLRDGLTGFLPQASVQPAPQHFEHLAAASMPDPDDRHVLAAAIAAHADVLCTANIKDFPDDAAHQAGITVMHPDELLSGLVHEAPAAMLAVHTRITHTRKNFTSPDLLDRLVKADAPTTAAALRGYLP
ncbi:PIN domain-containing protein [Myceligenerans indicum]|uniref:PIN domain-containing protein n=1 Tax=Myceligenerans indicum TaxID=2593663 RepID=A0ABS1LSS0_9MICO|nr:PIN domain-containing protein [Myceligenerans indicum]MBL0888858.1 PIN domain-containing protein [Myceligenerans indicum]